MMHEEELTKMRWSNHENLPLEDKIAALHYGIDLKSKGLIHLLQEHTPLRLLKHGHSFRTPPYNSAGELVYLESSILWHQLVDRCLHSQATDEIRDTVMDSLQQYLVHDISEFTASGRAHFLEYNAIMIDLAQYPGVVVESKDAQQSVLWHFGIRLSRITGVDIATETLIAVGNAVIVMDLAGFCDILDTSP